MKRSKGYRVDTPDSDDYLSRHLLRGPGYGASSPSMLALRGPRQYQDGVSCCVGEALARAIHMSLRAQGHSEQETPMPSPLFHYAVARRQEVAGDVIETRKPLVDKGCQPRHAMQGTRAVGFVEESLWSFDYDKRNTDPTPDVLAQAYSQKGFVFTVPESDGDSLLDEVAAALSKGFPVLFGMDVDTAFENHVGSEVITNIEATDIQGGHMLTALEVRGDALMFDNWWGTDWGFEDGFGLLSRELLGSMFVSSIYIIKAAPLFAPQGTP